MPRIAAAMSSWLGTHQRLNHEASAAVKPGLDAVLAAVPGALSRYQIAADPTFGAMAPAALAACRALGVEVIVPLRFQDELRGLLLLGPNLAKFVPRRARQLIEASPEAPSLDKREADVTVLFADITGYTRLSSRLAPEVLDGLVERYFGAFLDEIVKPGGSTGVPPS